MHLNILLLKQEYFMQVAKQHYYVFKPFTYATQSFETQIYSLILMIHSIVYHNMNICRVWYQIVVIVSISRDFQQQVISIVM